ncbi:MAG: methylase, partial [Prevotella sp.]|nr:methylase [Prevotella sp.]
PPFVGYSLQSKEQKADILSIYVDEKGKPYKTAGKIDYVAGWYFRASSLMHSTGIQTAFVSTNSITQGEQVASVWKPLCERFGVSIDFAYRTFRWDSEATLKAHVHCVIVGFSCITLYNVDKQLKKLYNSDKFQLVKNISPYLISADNIFIESRKKPVCDVPEMTTGNRPADGGNLIIEAEDYKEFIRKEPNAIKYIKKLTDSAEYINNKDRYCLWLVNCPPNELRSMPLVMKRVEACRQDRLQGADDRKKLAETPTVFRETKNPERYIIIPAVSSEKRRYIPIGFLDSQTIPTNLALIIPNANLYHFGVLTSNIHMAWVRTVCGRLKSDYRYSKDIVYNNFPFPEPTPEQRERIECTARAILDARTLYHTCTLADLYDELAMPPELRKAHQQNDLAVMTAYGFDKKITESECVAELMKIYQKFTAKQQVK